MCRIDRQDLEILAPCQPLPDLKAGRPGLAVDENPGGHGELHNQSKEKGAPVSRSALFATR
jgi:hypothetical protein